jgi:hypothetical protein
VFDHEVSSVTTSNQYEALRSEGVQHVFRLTKHEVSSITQNRNNKYEAAEIRGYSTHLCHQNLVVVEVQNRTIDTKKPNSEGVQHVFNVIRILK